MNSGIPHQLGANSARRGGSNDILPASATRPTTGTNKGQSPTHYATTSFSIKGTGLAVGGIYKGVSNQNIPVNSNNRVMKSNVNSNTTFINSGNNSGSYQNISVNSLTASSRTRNYSDNKREGLKTILTFLSKRGYHGQINPKSLSSPTRTLYLEVLQFIINQYDPKIKLSRPDEDIPRFFKDIGYPFTINKTTIIAPGAPNTWPQHIAAMSWLCELLDYEQATFPYLNFSKEGELNFVPDLTGTSTLANAFTGTAGSMNADHMSIDSAKLLSQTLNKRLSESYKLFLGGQSDGGLLAETLEAYCRERKGQAQQAFDRKKQDLEQMQMEMQKIQHELQEGDLLFQKNHTLSQDILKMEYAVGQCLTAIRQVDNSYSDKENIMQIKRKELRTIEDEVEKLQKRIATQSIQRDDVSRVYQDMKVKRQTIRNLRSDREKAEKENWALELQIEELSTKLYQLSRLWNNKYQEIINITSNEIRNHEIGSFNSLQNLSMSILNSDELNNETRIDDIIGQSWRNMKHSCKKCIVEVEMWRRKLKTQEIQFNEIIKSTKDTIIQKKQACDALEKKIRNLDGDMTVCDKREMRQLEQIQEKVKKYKTEFEQKKDEALKRLETARSRVAKLEQQLVLAENHAKNELQQCKQVINSDVSLLHKLKSNISLYMSQLLNNVVETSYMEVEKNELKLTELK
ncbi:hec ndc80p family protein [Cryptosporidium andersoni]|uniref:Kinetochore protein NDC80 n=1 Tax=Cryptosporidium andersoni TaxID=117008 RepID=A0A1J4MH53_9CRYT|nr:hec ndc80p family protein [Cryptosporidium andersoni]